MTDDKTRESRPGGCRLNAQDRSDGRTQGPHQRRLSTGPERAPSSGSAPKAHSRRIFTESEQSLIVEDSTQPHSDQVGSTSKERGRARLHESPGPRRRYEVLGQRVALGIVNCLLKANSGNLETLAKLLQKTPLMKLNEGGNSRVQAPKLDRL